MRKKSVDRMRLRKELNDVQREAVTHEGGPLLIIAGAGSGKTRVLTYRVAHLISQGIPPFNFLGVTFTNKAAEEMRARVRRLAGGDVWISTFHSTCLKILRHETTSLGMNRNFAVYDENDQRVLIRECLEELKFDERSVHPKGIREAISRAKDDLRDPEDLFLEMHDFYDEVVAKVYEMYEAKLKALQGLDFGDLIKKTVELFENNPKVLEAYQERFKYILIDEYQDTNHAQYRWVRLLADRHRNITVVGDPDQSIYAWRGADISNILNFERDYPEARLILMEQNYRSTMNILKAANALIAFNRSRRHKALWSENGLGEKIVIFEAADEREEAATVVQEVIAHKTRGIPLNEICIFYRIHAQSRILEDLLRKRKIPYKIVGGIRFYDRKEIKDVLAYLRVLCFTADALSLKRILNVPQRGIGKKSLEVLQVFAGRKSVSLWQSIVKVGEIKELGPKVRQAVSEFHRLIETLKEKKKESSPTQLIQEILERTGYLQRLEKEKTLEARSRIENLKEFMNVAYEFEENYHGDLFAEGAESANSAATGIVEAFIESVSLQTDIDEWQEDVGTLTLMTLHCAKGLEFPIVFIVGMEEDLLPHVNSRTDSDRDLEEERRLCYVGMTRAKQRLYLSYANSRRLYGVKIQNMSSRFLNEIPTELCETVVASPGFVDSDRQGTEEVVEYDFSEKDTADDLDE